MFGKGFSLLVCALLVTLLGGCSVTLLSPEATPDQELLYQVSTLSALGEGEFDGHVSMTALLEHGDFGLGTFNALDGEMVVLDGTIYQVRADGVATVADAQTATPFAAVTFFEADQTITLGDALDCTAIQAEIDSQLPALDTPYAVRIRGEFTSLTVRVPHSQSEPYPTLTEALTDQVLFESQNISGTLVGFRLPEYMAGVNSAGYHFHFIADDKQHGGHVLACEGDDLMVEIDSIDRVYLDITPHQQEAQ